MKTYQIILYIILGIITIGLVIFILSQLTTKDENKLILNDENKLILTDITNQITYNKENISLSFRYDFGNYTVPTYIVNDYGNFYITITENYTRFGMDNKTKIINSRIHAFASVLIMVNNVKMNENNYIYLAMQNKIISTNLISQVNENINFDVNIYAIPKNKMIMKVEGLLKYSDKLVDMIMYDYEFGPEEKVILTLKERKNKNMIQYIPNIYQM